MTVGKRIPLESRWNPHKHPYEVNGGGLLQNVEGSNVLVVEVQNFQAVDVLSFDETRVPVSVLDTVAQNGGYQKLHSTVIQRRRAAQNRFYKEWFKATTQLSMTTIGLGGQSVGLSVYGVKIPVGVGVVVTRGFKLRNNLRIMAQRFQQDIVGWLSENTSARDPQNLFVANPIAKFGPREWTRNTLPSETDSGVIFFFVKMQ